MLKKVFDNLNDWRNLPAYQLERRADIFFSLYLKEVVEDFGKKKLRMPELELSEIIIPEFPLKKKGKSNQSVKVDYALFAKDRSTVFFIELKTDNGSTRDEQEKYLKQAKEDGFPKIMNRLKKIFAATTDYEKYFHLARKLERLGLLSLPEGMEDKIFKESRRQGLKKMIEEIDIERTNEYSPAIELLYLKPIEEEKDQFPVIDFDFFASHVELHEDTLSCLFAKSLRGWKQKPGLRAPKA